MSERGGERVRGRGPLGRALFVAALVHAQLLALLVIWTLFWAPRAADIARRIDAGEEGVAVTALDDEAARKILAELDRQDEAKPPEPERKPKEPITPPGQVVDLPKP